MNHQKKEKRMKKGSVFTDLFRDSGYAPLLYQSLHPEDQDVQEEDLEIITLENRMASGSGGVLGFIKGGKLLVLTEQNIWTSNMLIMAMESLLISYQRYFSRHDWDLCQSKKVELPIPELYILYTGERKSRPAELCLSEEFFHGETSSLDVKAKMIYGGKKGDVINQYVTFTKVLAEQVELYGKKQKAVTETIHLCKNKRVLGEYLEKREGAVMDLLMERYDQEERMRVHDKRIARDSGIRNVVKALKELGFPCSEIVNIIAERFHLSSDRAEKEVQGYWD